MGIVRPLNILYEDDSLIVVNKRSGMLVIPTAKGEKNTLTHLLNEELDAKGIEINAYPCHRIDRETSGLIVYAKGKSMQQKMMDSFKHRKVHKTYLAFVSGTVSQEKDTLKDDLYNRTSRKTEFALMHYKVLARKKGYTVVQVDPVTGRKNQIRIQFEKRGHPLLGERVYAFRRDIPVHFRRLALHAQAIEFMHPRTGKLMRFTAPLPEDMESFLRNN